MKIMSREEFAMLLRELAEAVEQGDSLEGSVTYTYSNAPRTVEVDGAIRIGNLNGQGGALLL